MSSRRPKKSNRTLPINASVVSALMLRRGFSVEELAGQAGLSVGTVNNALGGKEVFANTLQQLASALGVTVETLLEQRTTNAATDTVHEYLLAEVLTDWLTASNGLRFQFCRMRHIELERQARAKRFDLRELPTDEQQRCRTWIKRHPVVCDRIGAHPNVARNLTAFHDPREDFYWVIDEWVEGSTLEAALRRGPMPLTSACRLIREVAEGLTALHAQGIVRRELSPASILLRETDGTAILTDFELAKLIDRGPTVSTGDWRPDPYRAPEADGEDVTPQADVYSWARIATHCLLGTLPPAGQDVGLVDRIDLPESVRAILCSSLSALRKGRPMSFDAVMPVVRVWREE